jgi:Glyoxalase-like domain
VAASIAVIVIDCLDSQPVAEFWMAALGYEIGRQDGTWILLRDPRGVGPLLAIDPVPESKGVKNRVHLDLNPADTMEAEVARLEQLGAQTVRVVQDSHTVMQDPEGNEFCVLQL